MPRHIYTSHADKRQTLTAEQKPAHPYKLLLVAIGEFCGTFMFLLLSFIGVQTALLANAGGDQTQPLGPSGLFYIASSFGAALAANVWIFCRVSGGMFNPAVSLGLVLIGAFDPVGRVKHQIGTDTVDRVKSPRGIDLTSGVIAFVAQILAGIAASAVADGLTPGPPLFANRLGGDLTPVQGLFLEMFLTAQLVLTVFFLADEKHRGTFLAPLGIGLSVFIAHICGTHWTGTSINPARSFGPDVIVGFASYHWLYWIGPLLGAVIAYALYVLLIFLKYDEHGSNEYMEMVVLERGELPLAQTHVFSVGHGSDGGDGLPPPSPTSTKHPIDSTLSEATNYEHV